MPASDLACNVNWNVLKINILLHWPKKDMIKEIALFPKGYVSK